MHIHYLLFTLLCIMSCGLAMEPDFAEKNYSSLDDFSLFAEHDEFLPEDMAHSSSLKKRKVDDSTPTFSDSLSDYEPYDIKSDILSIERSFSYASPDQSCYDSESEHSTDPLATAEKRIYFIPPANEDHPYTISKITAYDSAVAAGKYKPRAAFAHPLKQPIPEHWKLVTMNSKTGQPIFQNEKNNLFHYLCPEDNCTFFTQRKDPNEAKRAYDEHRLRMHGINTDKSIKNFHKKNGLFPEDRKIVPGQPNIYQSLSWQCYLFICPRCNKGNTSNNFRGIMERSRKHLRKEHSLQKTDILMIVPLPRH